MSDLCRRSYIGFCRGGVRVSAPCRRSYIGVCRGGVCVRYLCRRSYCAAPARVEYLHESELRFANVAIPAKKDLFPHLQSSARTLHCLFTVQGICP